MKRLVILFVFLAAPLWAVQPDEILDDPALEARARSISQGLRCLVCQNESIDESHASLARDLRILLRERLVAGDSDTEAVRFIVDRYGEYVLLTPTLRGANWLLWAAGPLMLLIAGGVGITYVRRRSTTMPRDDALSVDEEAQLSEILKD